LDTIPWVEHLHLSHGPTMEIFCAPKQTVKSAGGWAGLELTEPWRTGSSEKQSNYCRWLNNIWDNNSRQAVNMIGKIYYNRFDICTLQRIYHWRDPSSCRFIYTCLNNCFLLVVTRVSEHRPNKRITYTLQKQISKKTLKEQTEPQNYTLIVEKKKHV